MSNIFEQIAGLSSEKRKLFEMLLREEEIDLSRSLIIPQKRESNTFPLSFAQQRLWFLDQLKPGSPLYNIPSAVRLTGRLDVAALEQSLNEIVRRHEVLRTAFARNNGQPVQVIAPQLALPLPIVDLRDLPEAEREAEALRLATEEAQRPFDLTTGPLLRTTLLRLDEEEFVALLTMHHIASDGWSMGVLIGEIAALYDAFSAGKPSPLPDLRVQYADFAHWQREWLQGEVLETQLNYWKRQLEGSPPMLELPTDRPRPAVQSSRGAHLSFTLPHELSSAIGTLSQQEGITLFMTLLAAFQTLLYRYTGQEDASVGTPIANRTRGEIEPLIGFLVNTLVLRSDLSGDPSFRELLRRVCQVTLDAYAHQDLPFEMLVEELQPQRDMSRAPLFQVMFALQNAPMQDQQLPDLTLSPVEAHSGTAKFDLTLTMVVEDGKLSGMLEYNTDLFDGATIERMVGHFKTLLEGIVANPDQDISKLSLLKETERRQLLVEWNDTARNYPQGQCLHQLFKAQVERNPDAVALVFEGEQLTYHELNRRANQLAHYLQKMGVGPDVMVGVCAERSLEMVIGLYGVLKAGGAYVPMDPTYPPERLAYMLEDSQVPVLLTQTRLVADLPEHRAKVICLDADWEAIAQESDQNPISEVTEQDLAYVIYTSGSTGKPKGSMIPHRGIRNRLLWMQEEYQLTADDRVMQKTPFSFDVSVWEFFWPLLTGACLVVARPEGHKDSAYLVDLINREQITTIHFVPPMLQVFLEEEKVPICSSLRRVICSGEALPFDLQERFFARLDADLHNLYGPTEASVDVTYWACQRESDRPIVPIGRPIANTQICLLDKHLVPVPVGVPGELHIGGVGLARGYHNRPELTAEKFIPDPYSKEPGACLYKTGDLACFLPDGSVEFLGRIDFQVKIRGFRIELGEIEAVLAQHPEVREVVVLAREDTSGDKRLVAYSVPKQEPIPTASELRSFLKEKLPEYMVPSAFVSLETLPLTPNGKVNRRALPAPDWSREVLEGEYVAPRTPVEEVLSGFWAEVLGVEQVGVHDNFFELGGHSLLATQLASRIRGAFQVELPLHDLFELPTLAELATSIDSARREAQGLSAPPIEPVSRDGELPLSFAQQRLWFLDQLEPGSPLYNVPDAVRITGSLDVAALEQSLNEIVRRHQVLRTAFPTVDGKPAQVIAPELTLPLPVVDLRDLPESEREAEASRLAAEEAQHPFDLARGPLLRVRLLRLGEEEHVALLVMHHIVSDAWSSGVLIREIAALYQAFSTGEPSPLPELPVQYADFAHWQRHWLQGEVMEAQLDYWKQQLSGSAALLELPTDRPRPAVQTFRGGRHAFVLPKDLSSTLKALSQQEGATMFMTLLAAFQTLLYRYTGQQDISVGTPIANRNWAEIEDLIGFFVNTLVMRTNLSGEPSFRELLGRVREAALGAYTHQDLPFETLVGALQPERNLSHSPLFQVMFALQSAPMHAQSLPSSDLTLGPVEAHSGMAKFDLTLFIAEEGGHLGGALEYNTDLFDAVTIERMLQHFEILLEGIVADPDRSIAELPLLAEAERQHLLVEWNATAAPYPQNRCVHQLFETQAEWTPDAIAVSFAGQHLTYAELNQRANQLAHHLQKQGVGPETLVGICVGRSLEMVVGLLGILKAGGAYLPLDPTYPPERLAFMIKDAQTPVLLTQAHLLEYIPTSLSLLSTLCLDTEWEAVAQESDENPVSKVTPENLAYVIYTSGSTGKPKGAMIIHRGLVNYLTWCQRAYPVAAGQGAPVHSSISFDLTITGLFAPLLVGRRVQILPEDVGVETLSASLQQERDYSLVKITPAHLELLSQQLSPEEVAGRTRAFIIGGENLLAESITFWQDNAPETVLVNEYGPTETVVGCCVYQVPEGERREGSVPIGRPIINTQLYILDAHMQPVPIGAAGELYIGGAGVARGYLNQAELTAERFIPDPFSDDPGARLYKTGDLCRYLHDGNIGFLGRIDDQVKVRGFRIELGEIEAVLSQHPAVGEAVALAREDVPGVKRLVGYVVPSPDTAPSVSELRRFLSEKLPEYMVPSAFMTLDALPLTPNGKVDRRALPAPDQARPELDAAYVAPSTHKEKILADVWSQVLGVKQVGVYDNFFELGGDSILSIQVIARANQAGLRLTPRQLFEAPTVARLAEVAGNGRTIHAKQGIVEGALPLTPIQHWFFEQNLPNPHLWRQTLLLEVRQDLDPDLLKATVKHLLAHHDALRLCFRPGPSGWEQVNTGVEENIPFITIDLSELPEAQQGPAIETGAAWLRSLLNLAEGALLRVAFFDLGPRRPGRLLITAHHLAIDGVSWRILMEDFQTIYQQFSQNRPVQLPPKTTSFQYWSQRLAEYAQSEAVRQELDYWLSVAQGSTFHLPLDFSHNGGNTEASAQSVVVSLSTEETQALLQEVPAAYRTEINDALLTVLAQALARWTGSRNLLVEMEGHGRADLFDDIDLSRTVGWFTTLFPVQLDLGDAAGPGKTLMTVKEQLRQVPNRGIGYGLLRYLCQDEENICQLQALPQPQVGFNYLGQFDQVISQTSLFGLAPEPTGPDRSPSGMRSHLLDINGGIAGGKLQLEWTYSDNLHQRDTVERLAQDFAESLRALIAHCQSPDAGGVTPSDFRLASLNQKKLDKVLARMS